VVGISVFLVEPKLERMFYPRNLALERKRYVIRDCGESTQVKKRLSEISTQTLDSDSFLEERTRGVTTGEISGMLKLGNLLTNKLH